MPAHEPWALDACIVGIGASFILGMSIRLIRVALSHHRLQRVATTITSIDVARSEVSFGYEIDSEIYVATNETFSRYVIPRCFIGSFSARTKRLREGSKFTCLVDPSRPKFGVLYSTGLAHSFAILVLTIGVVAFMSWYAMQFLSVWEWYISGVGGFLIGSWYYWSWPSKLEDAPMGAIRLFGPKDKPQK